MAWAHKKKSEINYIFPHLTSLILSLNCSTHNFLKVKKKNIIPSKNYYYYYWEKHLVFLFLQTAKI